MSSTYNISLSLCTQSKRPYSCSRLLKGASKDENILEVVQFGYYSKAIKWDQNAAWRHAVFHQHSVSWQEPSRRSPSPRVTNLVLKWPCSGHLKAAVLVGTCLWSVIELSKWAISLSLRTQWWCVHSSDGHCKNVIHELTKGRFSSAWSLRQQLIFSQVLLTPTNNIPSLHTSFDRPA